MPATLPRADEQEAERDLQAPAGAMAPGQAAVLYDGERVLGRDLIRPSPGAGRGGLTRSPLHLYATPCGG
jgi:hypothetical protein